MLFEGIIFIFVGVIRALIQIFPNGNPPGWMETGAAYFPQVIEYGSGLGAFIPYNLAGAVLTAVVIASGIGLAVKLVRVLASFATFGGGSAG